jgi:hypothetical protein
MALAIITPCWSLLSVCKILASRAKHQTGTVEHPELLPPEVYESVPKESTVILYSPEMPAILHSTTQTSQNDTCRLKNTAPLVQPLATSLINLGRMR